MVLADVPSCSENPAVLLYCCTTVLMYSCTSTWLIIIICFTKVTNGTSLQLYYYFDVWLIIFLCNAVQCTVLHLPPKYQSGGKVVLQSSTCPCITILHSPRVSSRAVRSSTSQQFSPMSSSSSSSSEQSPSLEPPWVGTLPLAPASPSSQTF